MYFLVRGCAFIQVKAHAPFSAFSDEKCGLDFVWRQLEFLRFSVRQLRLPHFLFWRKTKMEENAKIPEDVVNEKAQEQESLQTEATPVNEVNTNQPTLKAPKLPIIIGGIVAGVAAISIALALVLGGGSNSGDAGTENNGGSNDPDSTHVHSFGAWSVTDEATCLKAGTEARVCTCGEKETKTIPTLEHTIVVDPAVAATCKKTGLTEGKHCSKCDTVIEAQHETPKAAHTYDNKYDEDCNVCGYEREAECAHTETEVILGKAASCTSTGLTDGEKCKKCGETIVAQQEIPTTAHTYDDKYDEKCNTCGFERDTECGHFEIEVIPGKSATCTSTGLSDGEKCKKCGEVVTSQAFIPMKSHTEETIPEVEATCTKTGLSEGKKCSVCEKILVAQQETPKIAHTYDDKYDESCNKCGFVRDSECAHRETETIKGYAATCTATGLTNGVKCKKCGEILTEQTTIAMKPHTETIDTAIEATCTATGLTEGKHCSVCSKVLIAQNVTSMKPHTEETDAAVEATCTTTGLTEGKHCSVCSKVLVAQNTVAMKPHTEVIDAAVPATCTKTGLTEGKHCSVCSKVLVAQQTISTINHIESDWIIDKVATKTEDGARHTECIMCGKKLSEDVILATGSVGLAYTVNSDNQSCTITGIGTCLDTHVVIPTQIESYKVTDIGDKAFADCTDITAIEIPSTVKTIGTRAFYGCTGIAEITIPASVNSISTQIFYKASNLSTVYYNSSYSSSENQFLNLNHITKIVFGGRYVPDICKGNTVVKTVEILDSVTSIDAEAFYSCTGLTSVVIGDSVTSIGECAFYDCDSLTSIVIPDSVTSIGREAFSYCNGLTSVVIGDSVTSIGEYAFRYCNGLKSIVIPDSVTSIGREAFEDCSSLIEVAICGPVKSLEYAVFRNCDSLKSVVIGNYVTDIEQFAFGNCSSLKNLTIGKSVSDIYEDAFKDCYRLQNVYYNGDIKGWCSIVKHQVTWTGDAITCSPMHYANNLYINGKLVTEITIPDTVTSIAAYSFMNCSSLKSITIPDSVTSIGRYAFYNCDSLTSIVIPDSVTSISNSAFYGCNGLTSIVIPDSVTNIGDHAFRYCNGLTSIVIPDSVTSIGRYAFYNCDSLTSIVIPDSVTSISNSAFSRCTSLTSVVIGDNVTSIGYEAFFECYKLVEVKNKSSLNIVAGSSNNGYVAYYAIEVRNGESKIVNKNDYLFYTYNGVNYLLGYVGDDTELTLPDSYNGEKYEIYNYAFYERYSLTSVVIPDSVTSIGEHAFSQCASLTSIVIPDSVTSIGEYAFWYCDGLTSITYAGTIAQWDSIEKGDGWSLGAGDYTIYCTDGTIAKNGIITYS